MRTQGLTGGPGTPNVFPFLTVNMPPRAWRDANRLTSDQVYQSTFPFPERAGPSLRKGNQ